MFEKVNPKHPDKIADRIAGMIVDKAYTKAFRPKCAIEVLIGHGVCHVMGEASVDITYGDIIQDVRRISECKDIKLITDIVPQDIHLANNQRDDIRCGDNGIFRGMPITNEQNNLTKFAKQIYKIYGADGKYIQDEDTLIICQSNIPDGQELEWDKDCYGRCIINPLGNWTGGLDVDTGATNRKLGSDMGDGITGGGLHGKDLSKADVSVNIYAHLKAQKTKRPVEIYCAIGDSEIDKKPYSAIVDIAEEYIQSLGGFEKFAEWGLINGTEE